MEIYSAIRDATRKLQTPGEFERHSRFGKKHGIELDAPKEVEIQVREVGKRVFETCATKELYGKGGAKRALKLSDGRALLIQNMDVDGPIPAMWERMVKEEVAFSKHLQKHGILTVNASKVMISLEGTKGEMPAYLCDSFEQLKAKNIYIIDLKNEESSTWICEDEDGEREARSILPAGKDHKEVATWVDMLKGDFIDDMANMYRANIVFYGDSKSYAIMTDENQVPVSLRIFAFDHSSKREKRSLPSKPDKKTLPMIKEAMKDYIGEFIAEEYHTKHLPVPQDQTHEKLIDDVYKKCWKLFEERYPNLVKEETKTGWLRRIGSFLMWLFCCGCFPKKEATT